jgi:hypothetical protein
VPTKLGELSEIIGVDDMEWLTGNSFFLIILLVCVGMHIFGHGHNHGNDEDKDRDALGQDKPTAHKTHQH